jgi:Rps23 Pro-64 3,4-dihydroxylase Tpa1-like proline 4-hydroxylase
MNDIYTIENFFPEEIFETIQEESTRTEWYLKQTTENMTKLQWSLKRDVVNYSPQEKDKSIQDSSLLIKVLKENLIKFNLQGLIVPSAVYFTLLMGHERNLIHKDRYKYFDGSKQSYTLILYLNNIWQAEWHGATLFYSDNYDNYIYGSLPKRNKAILFKSNIKHSIEPFFQDLSGPRVNLICQFDLFE